MSKAQKKAPNSIDIAKSTNARTDGYKRLHPLATIKTVKNKSKTVGNADCINTTGPTQQNGYKTICRSRGNGRETLYAHRVAWELANGTAVPGGYLVRHTCDNPRCVNPDHLTIGTHVDNARDAIERGQRKYKITIDQIKEFVRSDFKKLKTRQALAKKYGVTVNYMSRFVKSRAFEIFRDDYLINR